VSIDTLDHGPARIHRYASQPASGASATTAVRTRAVFGQVMGLIALTAGCVALGAYIGRDLTGGAGIAFLVGSLVCVIGLHVASEGGREQLATTLLFGLGLLLGWLSALSSTRTRTQTPLRCGRPQEPRGRRSGRSATRPAATCPPGRELCSGR
jgi:hypothetical protein